ncbi:OmpA family protein [Demequina salsinemoris]|uniref:OmpA family protein n=1 Tax=Demequina salsinemoris TaxID=577470 RepID=UPI0007804539|nr:OmpA family protein [Demequina salsinemoris]
MNGVDRASHRRYVAGPIRWWLLLLGIVLTLTLVTWGFVASVAASAEDQAESALAQAGLDNVIVDGVRYREIDLRGPASDEEAALDAVSGLALITALTYTSDDSLDSSPSPEPTPTVTEPTDEPSESTEPSVSASATPTPTASASATPEETVSTPLPEFEPVLFEAFSSDLTAATKKSLDSVADSIIDAMETHAAIVVQLDAYSDSYGTDEENQQLTEDRADNVADYLTRAGVPPDIIETAAHGEESPVVSNATEAGRAQNRRVEITITEEG